MRLSGACKRSTNANRLNGWRFMMWTDEISSCGEAAGIAGSHSQGWKTTTICAYCRHSRTVATIISGESWKQPGRQQVGVQGQEIPS